MDVEDLTKSQLILLTLLVSFVTSMATGIVTVTLVNEAPEGVSRTITHVVERTVEEVVPKAITQTATVVKEVPVVVTEEELVVKAINRASPAVVAIRQDLKSIDVKILGSAFLSDAKLGTFITASGVVEKNKNYIVVLENGVEILVKSGEINLGKITLKTVKEEDILKLNNISPLKISATKPVIGQSVISLTSTADNNHEVSMGIISSVIGSSSTTPGRLVSNVASLDYIGAPIIDIYGAVVGIVTGVKSAITLD